ncbi:MAG TPA: sugar transferase, partial [Micromonosporaceae bacterium]
MHSDGYEFVPPAPSGVPRNATWVRHHRISTWHRSYTAVLLVIDFVAVALTNFIAGQLVGHSMTNYRTYIGVTPYHILVYVILPFGWLAVLWGHGAYDRRYLGMGTDEFKRIVRAAVTMMALVSFVAFTAHTGQLLSRVGVALALVGGMILILLCRFAARRVLHIVRGRGGASHRLLLIGTLSESLEVHAAITRTMHAGMVPVAIHLTDGHGPSSRRPSPVPVFSNRDVMSLVQEIGADTVAVCGSASGDRSDLRRLAWQLEGTGVDLVVAPTLTDVAGPRINVRPVAGLPLLHVDEPEFSGVRQAMKVTLEWSIATAATVILLPVIASLALAVRMDSPGAPLFRQKRVGKHGREFTVYKLRTMRADAESLLDTLREQNEAADGLLFKMRSDPRVTRVGAWLRKLSLDELPQLWNVVR